MKQKSEKKTREYFSTILRPKTKWKRIDAMTNVDDDVRVFYGCLLFIVIDQQLQFIK